MSTPEIDILSMRQAAQSASDHLRGLAHPDRLLLLCQLSQGEACVSELEDSLNLHQPSLSQQLGVLRRQGLVKTRRDGRHVYYRIADPNTLRLLQTLYSIFCNGNGAGT
ncbi:metalloregulator ArsR/SmtB family transcription factor [Methylonatrum kenyense]|uniref:ArsR/SmtB family transcription factor n=1 Tax=Methylonatrum kenyense TaxID=455253 RepID=UPI0020BDE599|nr:metalloregulator ArsR/SmtB family transcription factor [Methylonatrum kenyense]MCK8515201.1 metalloregulator ArsR/SmtB family transcription factor [Methylonatrum kenyense]